MVRALQETKDAATPPGSQRLSAERPGEAWRTPAQGAAARRPYIIHCQMGPRAACAGGSLCAPGTYQLLLARCLIASSRICRVRSFPPPSTRGSLRAGAGATLLSGPSRASSQRTWTQRPPVPSHCGGMRQPWGGAGRDRGDRTHTQRAGRGQAGSQRGEEGTRPLHPGSRLPPHHPTGALLPAVGGSGSRPECWLWSVRGSVCAAVKWE